MQPRSAQSDSSDQRGWRRWLRPLRLAVSGSLLVYLVVQANPLAIWAAWQTLDLRLLALAFGLQLGGIALSAAKWGVLLQARGQRQPYAWLLGVYLVGQFANNFLPTNIGGDALRAVQLGRRIGSFGQASAAVFIERLTGFLVLGLIACTALLLALVSGLAAVLATEPGLLLLAGGATLLALSAVGISLAAPWLLRRAGPFVPGVARRPLESLAQALADYFPRGRALALVMGMSVLFQSSWVVLHIVCGLALGLDVPLLLYALLAPLSDIVGLLPFFFNNIGAREALFTVYLGQVGYSPATAVALALLIFSIRLVASVPGGLVLLFGGAGLGNGRDSR